MIELPQGGVRERTAANVRDSDGTIVISFGAPAGGTRETLERCFEMGRPNFLIAAKDIPPTKAVLLAAEFVKEHQVSVLNVAGPRASEGPRRMATRMSLCAGCSPSSVDTEPSLTRVQGPLNIGG